MSVQVTVRLLAPGSRREAEPSERGEGVRMAGLGPRALRPFLAAVVEML